MHENVFVLYLAYFSKIVGMTILVTLYIFYAGVCFAAIISQADVSNTTFTLAYNRELLEPIAFVSFISVGFVNGGELLNLLALVANRCLAARTTYQLKVGKHDMSRVSSPIK